MRFIASIIALSTVPACVGGETGDATLTTNRTAPVVSAWSTTSQADFLLSVGASGPGAYVPWTIYLGSVPSGTSCGGGDSSLDTNAASWLVAIQIGVPYTAADASKPEIALQPGTMPVTAFSSVEPFPATTAASIQVFDDSTDEDVMMAGTLTIASFSDEALVGSFDATGGATTASATASFTANRCD
jgi:hypothetical protein